MTATQSTYTLDNAWEKAHRRLGLIESIYDPGTISRLIDLAVDTGWSCLEVGAGGGSIARWLSDRVGPTGSVVAVDLEPRFLEGDPRPNLEVHRRDIVADGVPGDGYDLIHARALLMHLPNRDELIVDLVGRLRPGGMILLEEGDAYPCSMAESALYAEVWQRTCAMAAKAGGDFYWARHLPARLEAAGAVGVTVAVEADIHPGRSPWAELTALSWEQVTPLLMADGLDAAVIDAATTELADPTRWFPACALVAASGRRP